MNFILERVKSAVSKKLGAAIACETLVAGTDLQGTPLLVYIVVQGVVDLGKHYLDSRD